MHESVKDAVGDGGIADLGVPGSDWKLAGQQRGTYLITYVADLQKIAALRFGQRGNRPIVHDQQVDPAEPVEQFAVATIGLRHSQIAEQFGRFEE